MHTQLFFFLYSLRNLHPFAPTIIAFIGHYLPYAMAGGLLLYLFLGGYYGLKKRFFILLGSFVSSGIGYLAVLLVRAFYSSPRPFTMKGVVPLIDASNTALTSFPSGHAAFFFALGTFLYFYNTRLGALYLIGAAFISVARVMAGVHWPFDIVAGAVLGILSAHFIRWFTQGIKKNL